MDKLTVGNQLTLAQNPRRKYRSIWLSTSDAVRSEDNKYFIFNKLPLIKVKKNTKLYVSSINLTPIVGDVAAVMNSMLSNGHFFIKMKNIKYNGESAMASNQDNALTLIDGYMPVNYICQSAYFVGELLEQELNFIELYINTRSNDMGAYFTVGSDLEGNLRETVLNWSINLLMEYEEDN
jgi:hypothetical protein